MRNWYLDDKNPDVVWTNVTCNRCGAKGRLGTIYNTNYGPYPDPMPDDKTLDKISLKTQKTWVCCPGPPLWWERIRRWWNILIKNYKR